jgi:uncharacterized protein (DUF58 family)
MQMRGVHAALPRHMPRGVQPALGALLDLRRYGTAMRRALALDDQAREGERAQSRSQGMDYAESRLYSPGDDVRRIDWRVTARTGRGHTKLYRVQRSEDLCCLVDQRGPMRFGTRAAFKSVVAAELAALTGWAAAAGGDRFGALILGVRNGELRSGPAERSTAALCAALAAGAGNEAPTDEPLDAFAARAIEETASGTRFVVISDFADEDAAFARAAQFLRARGTLLLVWVLDPVEERFFPSGRYPLTDGRDEIVLDAAAPGVRAAHAREFAARRERLARCAALPGTRCILVRTGEDLFSSLERRFVLREVE